MPIRADRCKSRRSPHAPVDDGDAPRYPIDVEYLVGAAHDVGRAFEIRLLFHVDQPCVPSEVDSGVRAHVEYELERMQRRRREQVRSGWVALAVAAIAVVLLTGLSGLVARVVPGPIGAAIEIRAGENAPERTREDSAMARQAPG